MVAGAALTESVVNVRAGSARYDVLIGPGSLSALPSAIQNCGADGAVVVTHSRLLEWYGARLSFAGQKAQFISVSPGERSKSFSNVGRIVENLADGGFGRGGVVIAFGGGVVGDLAGFVAAVYHRGIMLIQLPTTLLAQVDASVGGKVGVDLPAGKNLAGAFLQPKVVIADTATLHTLPKRHIRNGMAEVLKYGMIMRAPFLDFAIGVRAKVLSGNPEVLAEIVQACCQMKADVVAEDERDLTGVRAKLNFGHTVGHAIESALGYRRLLHGEAVSIGMVAEAKIAERLGLCGEHVPREISGALGCYSLPVRLPADLDPADLVTRMYKDKKVVAGKLTLVLPREIGSVELVPGVDPAAVTAILREMR